LASPLRGEEQKEAKLLLGKTKTQRKGVGVVYRTAGGQETDQNNGVATVISKRIQSEKQKKTD